MITENRLDVIKVALGSKVVASLFLFFLAGFSYCILASNFYWDVPSFLLVWLGFTFILTFAVKVFIENLGSLILSTDSLRVHRPILKDRIIRWDDIREIKRKKIFTPYWEFLMKDGKKLVVGPPFDCVRLMHFLSLNSKLVSQKDLEESKDARDKYEVSILCVTIPLALLFAIGNILYAEKDIPKFVKSQNLKALSILIHSGLNVDKVHYRQTLTPLGYAALDDSTNVVSYLLDNGANVNQTFRHGETALMLAVQKNAVDSVRSLIAHGANLSHTRDDGKRAIDLAPTNASPELVRLLNSGSK